ncbi:unnamed protein product [Calicophoron daubneyi]|uniref:VASt domain-containing protein n=1 Tax=Calicophoron daubneyi TaxID=300641 RepID=A0AAV2T9D4_CALDB
MQKPNCSSTAGIKRRGISKPNRYTLAQDDLCSFYAADQNSYSTRRKKLSKLRHARSEIFQDVNAEPVQLSWLQKDIQNSSDQQKGEDLEPPATCSPGHDHSGIQHLDTELPLGVDALFTCVFTDSEFFDRLCTYHTIYNVTESSWPPITWPAVGHRAEDTGLPATVERTIKYTSALKRKIGPSSCTSTERQIININESRPGEHYVVDCEITNLDVPMCTLFYVTLRYCLLRISPVSSRMLVCSQMHYTKRALLGAKTIIETCARSGIEDYLTSLANSLISEASRLNEEDRRTGGFLAKPGTNKSFIRDFTEAGNSMNRVNADITTNSNTKRDGGFVSHTRNQSACFVPPLQGLKVHPGSSSSHVSANGLSCNPRPPQVGTRPSFCPDRLWPIMILFSLLLCLWLSVLYSRVLTLEKLAQQVSVVTHGNQFSSDELPDSASFHSPRILADQPRVEMTRSQLAAMKELTHLLSKTLAKMQRILATVSQSIDLLEQSYMERHKNSASTQSYLVRNGHQKDSANLTHQPTNA